MSDDGRLQDASRPASEAGGNGGFAAGAAAGSHGSRLLHAGAGAGAGAVASGPPLRRTAGASPRDAVGMPAGIARPGTAAPSICVVLHDVAAGTQPACERVMQAVADVAGDIPLTLLAVPRYHGEPSTAGFERWLGDRARAGDELSLHGWTHRDDGRPAGWLDGLRRSHYTRGEGEFWSLSQDEAAARIAAGQAWFDANGWTAHGFVAPAWLLGPGAWAALRAASPGFAYTSTLRHIHRLPDGPTLTSQSVVYSTSSGWRRAMSLAWNAGVAAAERANPLLRLELHPRDADFPAIRRSWQRLLAAQLHGAGRRAVTVAEAAGFGEAGHAAATSAALRAG